VIGDPFGRLPTRARLWGAAGLTVLPLGLVWTASTGVLMLGAQASARVFLAFAAAALAWVATRVRTPATRRVARLATVALAGALVLAVRDRAVPAVLCLGLALVLTAPPAWRSVPKPGAFGTGGIGR
jgi:hypothetical protein